jgi:hypothetical protein
MNPLTFRKHSLVAGWNLIQGIVAEVVEEGQAVFRGDITGLISWI